MKNHKFKSKGGNCHVHNRKGSSFLGATKETRNGTTNEKMEHQIKELIVMFNFEMVDDKAFHVATDSEKITMLEQRIKDLEEDLKFMKDLVQDAYEYFGG